MIKFAITISAAALLAGLLTILPGMAPNVEAGTVLESAAPKAEAPVQAGKGDRHGTRARQPVTTCLVDFDGRFRGEPRKVRLVTTDRLQ